MQVDNLKKKEWKVILFYLFCTQKCLLARNCINIIMVTLYNKVLFVNISVLTIMN